MPSMFEEQRTLIIDPEIVEEICITVLAKLKLNTSRIPKNLYFFMIRF